MATNNKRQRKLERRSAKRHEKKHRLVKLKNAGLAERIAAAAKHPVLHSRVSETFWSEGIGHVLLSRQLPGGSVAVGFFLVDRFCLGVKDAFARIVPAWNYESEFVRGPIAQFRWHDLPPAAIRKLVEDAVAYAANLTIPPHPDYHKAKVIFGDIDPNESSQTFEFGQDGKPFFVVGPHDTPDRCRRILAILTHECGPDGFHYRLPGFVDPGKILPAALMERLELAGQGEDGNPSDRQFDSEQFDGEPEY